jgi:hypothetical protein
VQEKPEEARRRQQAQTQTQPQTEEARRSQKPGKTRRGHEKLREAWKGEGKLGKARRSQERPE